jgi:hypothetical protein
LELFASTKRVGRLKPGCIDDSYWWIGAQEYDECRGSSGGGENDVAEKGYLPDEHPVVRILCIQSLS